MARMSAPVELPIPVDGDTITVAPGGEPGVQGAQRRRPCPVLARPGRGQGQSVTSDSSAVTRVPSVEQSSATNSRQVEAVESHR